MGAKIHLSFHIYTFWANIRYMEVENLTKVFNITKFQIRCLVSKVYQGRKCGSPLNLFNKSYFPQGFVCSYESGFIIELLCPLRKRPLSKNCFEEARGKFVFPYEKLCSVKRISLCVCKTSF